MRMRLSGIVIAGLLATAPAQAQRMLVLGAGGPLSTSSYTGPGDIVSGALFDYSCSRGYSAAYAAPGTGKACNIRRASDNATQDIVILTTGAFDLASYNTFVGTDTTGTTCTIAGTALACVSNSGTIHVKDPVTGVGITNPCVVTATNGSTTATVVIAGTSNSCGTVSVGETMTFQVAGFVTKGYDQSGNARDAAQATAGNQPQLLPICPLPCVLSSTAPTGLTTSGSAGTSLSAQPWTVSAVLERVNGFTSNNWIAARSGLWATGFGTTTGNAAIYAGNAIQQVASSNSALHSNTYVANGASSLINVDGTPTTTSATPGANALTLNFGIGADDTTGASLQGYWSEVVGWSGGLTNTQQTNVCHNQFVYYTTAASC